MKTAAAALVIALITTSTLAQTTFYSVFEYDGEIPHVAINDRSASLQASLYETMYLERSARSDMRWVSDNDSALVSFWTAQGDTLLHILRELSGIEWQEREFDIYLVRYYPGVGSSDPLVLPVGGIGERAAFEVAPDGSRQILNLTYQLARRILAQTVQPENGVHLGLAYHPLMRQSAYRFDLLAMLLALSTCQHVIGADSTVSAYQSAFWRHHLRGRAIFEDHLWNRWILTPERPLSDWVADEPYGSELVMLTRPPRKPRPEAYLTQQPFVEGLPMKGQLGLSTRIDQSGRLEVSQADIYRLGYACGLREGDRIHSVEGKRVRNQKQLVESILDNLEQGGATLEVIRDGESMLVLIQPMQLLDLDDYYDAPYEDTVSSDSTFFDETFSEPRDN